MSLLAALCVPASAQDETSTDAGALPSVDVMPCLAKCGVFVPAQHLDKAVASFPRNALGDFVEGLVRIHYIVGIDGRVHDVTVLDLKGPQIFADSALRSMENWTFKPATLNGQPVAESMILNYVYDIGNIRNGARPDVYSAYQQAIDLIKNNKLDDAAAKLKEQADKHDLNFYERGMMANLLGVIAIQQKDYQEASAQVRVATDFYTKELPPVVTVQLYKTRIISSLAKGDIMDAMGATRRLQQVKGFDSNDPISKAVTDVRAKLDAAPEFSISSQIPLSGAAAQVFYLYRRDFTFRNIKGGLGKFALNCKQSTVQSDASETAEWHVPHDWSQCYIIVRGTPGTSFDVVEFAPGTPSALPPAPAQP
jgi:TonB family protein